MQLLFLLLVLLAPNPVLALLERIVPRFTVPPRIRNRVGVSAFFSVTSAGHYRQTDAMAEMLPPFVPHRQGIIYVTGVFELLGAAGLWIPRLERLTGKCLLLLLLGFIPANIYAALKRVNFGGHAAGPAYLLVRLPFQGLVMWFVYRASLADVPRQ